MAGALVLGVDLQSLDVDSLLGPLAGRSRHPTPDCDHVVSCPGIQTSWQGGAKFGLPAPSLNHFDFEEVAET